MLDWDKLRVFHAVAIAESLTRAGDALNLSQSAVSRQISALESSLQCDLFHRHARGLMLSEQGEILLKSVTQILAELSRAENELIETRERPRGPLKITTPIGFGTNWLAPTIKDFIKQFPEISVTLLVDDREMDLTMRVADVAIRLYPAKHPDLVQKKLMSFSNGLYPSNDYIATHGTPKKLEELAKHQLICYPEEVRPPYSNVHWVTKKVTPERPPIRINSMVGMLSAVQSGAGIASLPDYIAQDQSDVKRILNDVKSPKTDMYFIYPLELRNSKRINVFRDFLIQKMQQTGLLVKG